MAAGSIPLAGDPNSAALIGLSPSANLGGGSYGGLPQGGPIGIGGGTNPFLPSGATGGVNMPSVSNPAASFAANSPSGGVNVPGLDLTGLITGGGGAGGGATGIPNWNWGDVSRGLSQAGYKSGTADLLAQFIASGAGYNPQVAQALIAQMQPGVSRNTANIMEAFGGAGSSAAGLALGDYMSQVQLNEGEILAGLYEQSVQNFLSVLTGAKAQPKQGGGLTGILGSLFGAAGQAFQGAGTKAIG